MTVQQAGVITQIVAQLAAETGRPVGDGQAPGGELTNDSYPYAIVWPVGESQTLIGLGGGHSGSLTSVEVMCVGLSRVQADMLGDRVRDAMLDPTVSLSTASTVVTDRRIEGRVHQSEPGVHNVAMTFRFLATPVV